MTDFLNDLISKPRVTSLVANRAGDAVLNVNYLAKDGNKYRSQLWQVAESGNELAEPYALTSLDSNAKLQVLADNGDIYYTLDKDVDGADSSSEKGVWKLGSRGEPQLALSFPGGIDELQVRETTNGTRLIFTATAIGDDLEQQAKVLDAREKTGASAVLYDSFPTRFWDHDKGIGSTALYVFDGDKPRRIQGLPDGKLQGFEVSPDGSSALITVGTVLRGIHQRSSVYRISLGQDAAPQLVAEADEKHSFDAGSFSPDGSQAVIYKNRIWLPGQSLQVTAHTYNLDTGEFTALAENLDRWPGDIVWLDNQRFAFATDNLGAGAVFVGEIGGDTHQLSTTDRTYYAFLSVCDGKLVALRNFIDRASEPIVIDPQTGVETELPSPVERFVAPGRIEQVKTTAEDGTEITSWLALPRESAGKHPLVVFAHGGPWGSWNSWTYRWNPWALTELGYAVLLPDPAISLGYGQKMLDRGGDAIGDTPYTDILALIDAASEREDVDGNNAAFMGGSYGGYMTNWVAGHAGTRFKCYVTHASLFNMENMYFTTDNGSWHEWMYEHENGQRNTYSPHQHIENVQAPMLVIHGDKDYRVPIGEGLALWASLQRNSPELGHKYLYYPDEGHWILKPENSRIWYQTVSAWLNQHLRGENFEAPENLGYTASAS